MSLVLFYNAIEYGHTKGLLLVIIVMVVMIPIVLLMGRFGDLIGNKILY